MLHTHPVPFVSCIGVKAVKDFVVQRSAPYAGLSVGNALVPCPYRISTDTLPQAEDMNTDKLH